ncbi:hypothetical protein F4810DRAFT_723142 [Camillea tinctor]|nr:hypothetical protein F4810DRAFT_723142 [Camillea tinctor]
MPRNRSRLYCALDYSSPACHQLFLFLFSSSFSPSPVSSSSSSMPTASGFSNGTVSASSPDDDGGGGDGNFNIAGVGAPISANGLIAIAAVAMALVTLFTAARMLTRWVLPKQRWWDDWAMVVAWIATIPLCGLQIVMARHGAGRNTPDVTDTDLAVFSRAYQYFQAVARAAIFLAKSSILLLEMRGFYPEKTSRDALWVAMLVAILLNGLYTVVFAAVVAAFHGDRIPWTALLACSAAVNLLSDVVALTVPLVVLRRLQTSRINKRYVVSVMVAVGALAPLAGLVRLAHQIVVANTPTAIITTVGGGAANGNVTVIYTTAAVLATVDQAVAVFVGCVPMVMSRLWRGARQLQLFWLDSAGKSRALPALARQQPQSSELLVGGEPRYARDPYQIPGDNADEEMLWWSTSSLPSSSSSSTRDVAVAAVDEAMPPRKAAPSESELETEWEDEEDYLYKMPKPLEPVFLCYDDGREKKLYVLFLPPLGASFEGKGCV